MGSKYAGYAKFAVKEKKSHPDYLEALLAAEFEERERNTVARRLSDQARSVRMAHTEVTLPLWAEEFIR